MERATEKNTKFLENPIRWTKQRWKGLALAGLGIALVLAAA